MTSAYLPYQAFQHSPSMCFEMADALWFASEQVRQASDKAEAAYTKAIRARMKLDSQFEGKNPLDWSDEYKGLHQKAEDLKSGAQSGRVAAMLRGFSLENELKGGWYAIKLMEHRDATAFDSMETHGLVSLCGFVKFPLDVRDKELMEYLTIMNQLGRYQIGHEKKKTVFHVNFAMSPELDLELRTRVKSHCRGLWAAYQSQL